MPDPSAIVMCDLTLRQLQEAMYAWVIEAKRLGWHTSLEDPMMFIAGQIGLFRAGHKAEVDAAVAGLISHIPGPEPGPSHGVPSGIQQIETILKAVKQSIADANNHQGEPRRA